ncbi:MULTISPECIES: methionine--tRNA ligase [Streptomyces]|uniref:methionine--tRNA ligase n=1 Tax=Streptomyces scabiei TaxID=1930 RepID=A0A100JR54_STRSC|nr:MULTISPECIES: class I tRNA ligase family protein [Streptomyces]MDX3065018.1 class I tRNA ligase family protein [Streptomyces sp. ND04-05B]GAQ64169.1 methionine--tRNA ligase [Streptomyces scabiei]
MSTSSFISATIPYVNSRPHLGHALEYVQADCFARLQRLQGRDVYFLTGSDENSLKNVLAAEQEGIPTQELVDRNVVFFQKMIERLELSQDQFIRTSVDPRHIAGATRIWELIAASGDIYKKSYEGLYCVGCEQFYVPSELVDGKCPEHHVPPERVSEENYFFRLSRYQDQLLEVLRSGELQVVPKSRYNEVVSFVESGLADISISRSTDRARGWGIPVPGDPSQVIYVWIDALTNYITALGWADGDDLYKRYWEDADSRTHVLGKGVTRFHAVYWPAMLMSAGLPLPTGTFVHGYITANGQKLSKSLGNAIDPMTVIDKYGIDAVRYALLADLSPIEDGDFNEERLVMRYTTDLANGLGNLVSRVATMVGRYRDGVIPQAAGELTDDDERLARQVKDSVEGVQAAMSRYDHRDALTHVGNLIRASNAYVDNNAPWHLAKAVAAGDETASARMDTVFLYLAGAIRQVGLLMLPFLPTSAEKILKVLGEENHRLVEPSAWLDGLAGRPMERPEPIFPRLDVVA